MSGDTWLALPLAQQHGCGEPGAKDEDAPEPSEGQIGHYQRVRGLVRASDCPATTTFPAEERAMTAIRRPGSGCHVTASPPDLRAVSSTPDGTTGSTPWRVAVPVSGLSSVPYTMTKTRYRGSTRPAGPRGGCAEELQLGRSCRRWRHIGRPAPGLLECDVKAAEYERHHSCCCQPSDSSPHTGHHRTSTAKAEGPVTTGRERAVRYAQGCGRGCWACVASGYSRKLCTSGRLPWSRASLHCG